MKWQDEDMIMFFDDRALQIFLCQCVDYMLDFVI